MMGPTHYNNPYDSSEQQMGLFDDEKSSKDRDAPSSIWHGSPVTRVEGPIEKIRTLIPEFETRPFQLADNLGGQTESNKHYQCIVKLPLTEKEKEVPVGIVSNQYKLVQHSKVLNTALEAIEQAGISHNQMLAYLRLSSYGERMALSLQLPPALNYAPTGDSPMALRLDCCNSVDGSTRFTAYLSWYRFSCKNSMALGIMETKIRRIHNVNLDVQDLGKVLQEGLINAESEKILFDKWRDIKIDTSQLSAWVNGEVRRKWGIKSAVRAYHIAKKGRDVNLMPPFEKGLPTEKKVKYGRPVAGIPAPAGDAFALSQVIAWLASHRREVQEEIDRIHDIPELMRDLTI
ncbi:DUF932 domain-containing protein [Fibrobacterota bacterium]